MPEPFLAEAVCQTFLDNPTRYAGLDRLDRFIPLAGEAYATRRNYDTGELGQSAVSGLSSWLRYRLITEEEVIRAVLAKHTYEAAEKFIQEVFWRIYFKGWLEQHPSVWLSYQHQLNRLHASLETNHSLAKDYGDAIAGSTGIECFDAWAQELRETGYLHNHSRMWFASIWVFTLGLPWQLGADFFYRNLIDGDPASNTLSWRWICGLHTSGKHYLARAENIYRYTNGRFNPRGQLNEDALPLAEEPAARVPLGIHERSCHGRYGLLITSENCQQNLWVSGDKPSVILGVFRNHDDNRNATNTEQINLGQVVVEDVVRRHADSLGVQYEIIQDRDLASRLPEWIGANKLDCLVSAYQTVGVLTDELAPVRQKLEKQGVPWFFRADPIDQASWPHANAGFFKLKKKIPYILSSIGVTV